MIPEPYSQTSAIPPVQWTRWPDPSRCAAGCCHSQIDCPAPSSDLSASELHSPEHLADMTTFGVGGKAEQVIEAQSETDLLDAIRAADDAGKPLLMVGGGSNILAADSDFNGIVLRDMRQSITTVFEEGCPGARMHVTAGTPWDSVVVYAVEHGWMGMEALSGIPGSAGAAIVQNIGAYGQEVAGTVASARTYDRLTKQIRTFFMSDMDLGYRTSIFKRSMRASRRGREGIGTAGQSAFDMSQLPRSLQGAAKSPRSDMGEKIWGVSPRWIILDVDFQLRLATMSEPVRYAPLAQKLGVQPGDRAPSADVRAAVVELRRSKGMVLDDTDRDTFSAGSFFVNPVLTEEDADNLPPEAPRFSVTDATAVNQIGAAAPRVPGVVKTSAAWLIDHAGFKPGYGDPQGAQVSSKHSLALTNQGMATGESIAALAREIKQGVYRKYGVTLEPEPVLLGLDI